MVVVEFATMHGLAMTTVYMTTVYNDSEDLFLENRLLYLYEVQVASGCLEFLTRTSRRCRESGKEGPRDDAQRRRSCHQQSVGGVDLHAAIASDIS